MTIREDAVRYAMSVILESTDWQEVEHALINDDRFAPWLESLGVDRDDTFCLSIIREAEDRLLKSGKMPPGYSD